LSGNLRWDWIIWAMETIRLMTWIDAPMERCFKLSASVDLHVVSAAASKEEAVDGVKTGIIGEGQTVTFRGRHFGLRLRHTSRIDRWRPCTYFRDTMVAGSFKYFTHEHFFAAMDDGTRMNDEIRFSAPYGMLGRWATKLLVRRHLIALLVRRNQVIKRVAESEEWHRYLDGRPEILQETPKKTDRVNEWPRGAVLPG
jgi:ligand-binding SRPBCC domain-containing protein